MTCQCRQCRIGRKLDKLNERDEHRYIQWAFVGGQCIYFNLHQTIGITNRSEVRGFDFYTGKITGTIKGSKLVAFNRDEYYKNVQPERTHSGSLDTEAY
jgi:hypothetical protein